MIWLGLFSGIAFGFVVQRVGATDAHKMARSHLMLDADIPRFMLLAVALSAVGLFGLQSVGVGRVLPLPTSIVATGLAAVIFGIGWGLTGYNNTTGEYESTWIDNMGTAIYLSKGKAGADSKQITQYMDYVDPMTKKATKVKTILSFDGPDNASFTWYNLADGKETKSMEMIYTRRK